MVRTSAAKATIAIATLSVFGFGSQLAALTCSAQDFAQLAIVKAAKSPVRERGHLTQRYVESWQDLQSKNVVMQQRDYSCGAAALATILRYGWGEDVDEADTLRALNQLLSPAEIEDRI